MSNHNFMFKYFLKQQEAIDHKSTWIDVPSGNSWNGKKIFCPPLIDDELTTSTSQTEAAFVAHSEVMLLHLETICESEFIRLMLETKSLRIFLRKKNINGYN